MAAEDSNNQAALLERVKRVVESQYATSEERVATVRQCLEQGLTFEAKDARDMTVFLHAVFSGDPKLVAMLIDMGADPNERFHRERRGAIIRDSPALHYTASWAPEVLDVLIGAGADVHAVDDHGCTALAQACAGKSRDGVLRLLQAGARIDARDRRGNTAMDEAVRSNDPDVLAIMRAYQAEQAVQDASKLGVPADIRPL